MEFANRVARVERAGLTDLFAPDEQTISFAGGLPDPAVFPKAALQAAFASRAQTDSAFQYANSDGYAPLRAQLAKLMQADGVSVNASDLLITQGAQQGIDLTARLLLNPGDGVVVEGPTYLGALAAFDAYEPTYYEVPVEPDGMDLHALQKILLTHSVKVIYTVPDFQNPTGAVMSLAKRQALIRLAHQYDVVILEDAPYRLLRYEGDALPTLHSLDPDGRVVLLGSFSKILSPGLRIGWLTAAPRLLQALTALKGGADVESSALVMQSISTYLASADFPQHLAKLRNYYRTKRDAMLTALASLPPAIHYTRPTGGFFVYLTGPSWLDFSALQQTELAEAHVALVPSKNLYPSHAITNGARLTFAAPALADIAPGIARLNRALTQVLHEVPAVNK
ncbi:PLP-dependent aminotransferase family protein [Lacticaseibacillus nasuensis]|uniref:aminotransferase-like domain-containing protein n=1 Tax=Lacticaseibacillus nasuensis TaxID=944671 RepID=UPI0006D0840C|nr:PLP-dependent aminotransferase family protein [Lacticaseibacillus nasuensis]